MRGLFEENIFMKNVGSPWKEGIVRFKVTNDVFIFFPNLIEVLSLIFCPVCGSLMPTEGSNLLGVAVVCPKRHQVWPEMKDLKIEFCSGG